MLVRWSVGPLVRWSVGPHITSKTDYVAIPSRLGFGDPLVFLFALLLSLKNQNGRNRKSDNSNVIPNLGLKCATILVSFFLSWPRQALSLKLYAY
jgi:hypothetical protein